MACSDCGQARGHAGGCPANEPRPSGGGGGGLNKDLKCDRQDKHPPHSWRGTEYHHGRQMSVKYRRPGRS
jgi:hypothetical protein